MDVRLRIAVTSEQANVSEVCRELGISRDCFYRWRSRYRAEGPAGLEARSRAPKRSPRRTGPELEEAIVSWRKQLVESGLDGGPATIQWHLGRSGHPKVPSEATIWRVLVRRGFVTPEPAKRPKRSYRRFEASAPNELWQADDTEVTMAGGRVKVLTFLDDHSRVALAVKALAVVTTEATWAVFCEATQQWGVPLGQLSDNGLNFSGRLRGFEVGFETNLRAIGVVKKLSRPRHPQTCGKVERFQQTMKKWLARQPLAADLAALQGHLDAFVDHYNHHRPHRGIGRITPAQRWAATPPAINLGVALPAPAQVTTVIADHRGLLTIRPWRIHLGTPWAHQTVTVHIDGTHFAAYIDHQLIRAAPLDTTRPYQPSGRPTGRPRPANP